MVQTLLRRGWGPPSWETANLEDSQLGSQMSMIKKGVSTWFSLKKKGQRFAFKSHSHGEAPKPSQITEDHHGVQRRGARPVGGDAVQAMRPAKTREGEELCISGIKYVLNVLTVGGREGRRDLGKCPTSSKGIANSLSCCLSLGEGHVMLP